MDVNETHTAADHKNDPKQWNMGVPWQPTMAPFKWWCSD